MHDLFSFQLMGYRYKWIYIITHVKFLHTKTVLHSIHKSENLQMGNLNHILGWINNLGKRDNSFKPPTPSCSLFSFSLNKEYLVKIFKYYKGISNVQSYGCNLSLPTDLGYFDNGGGRIGIKWNLSQISLFIFFLYLKMMQMVQKVF